MKILITGATGFIGSVLVHKLLSQGYSVRALVLPGEECKNLSQAGVEIAYGDLTNTESIAGICILQSFAYSLAVNSIGSSGDRQGQ
ncbi:MAG: NAD-dependent epimerase/dehydratase family protein [Spirochaetota bacterium]